MSMTITELRSPSDLLTERIRVLTERADDKTAWASDREAASAGIVEIASLGAVPAFGLLAKTEQAIEAAGLAEIEVILTTDEAER